MVGARRHRRDSRAAISLCVSNPPSRQSYPQAAECLRAVLATAKKSYPDLWATLKFVPKKNGLNPMVAAMEKGGAPPSLEGRTPREARRALEDLTRALEQACSLVITPSVP